MWDDKAKAKGDTKINLLIDESLIPIRKYPRIIFKLSSQTSGWLEFSWVALRWNSITK